jgi:hypothetical protein
MWWPEERADMSQLVLGGFPFQPPYGTGIDGIIPGLVGFGPQLALDIAS